MTSCFHVQNARVTQDAYLTHRKQKIFIVFRKPMYNPFDSQCLKQSISMGGVSDNILRYVCGLGEHIHCEIFVPHMRCGNDLGFSFTNFSGDKMQLRSDMKLSYLDTPQFYNCLVVPVNQTEYDTFISQNMALVERHVPYNYTDCFLTILPKLFKDTFIQDQTIKTPGVSHDQLQTVRSLFCAQSIILTLRVSLEKDHKLFVPLNELTARCTTPQELFNTLQDNVASSVPIQNTIVK
jgi:hypothetical protein